MQPVGGTVYLGGLFTGLVPPAGDGRPGVVRNRLAALDVASGALLPWDPDANGIVRAMALSADRTKLYVGGDFNKIGGVSAPKIALLDLASGQVVKTFKSNVKGRIESIALSGNRLYVGGDFANGEGPHGQLVARNKVAALDATTGALVAGLGAAAAGTRPLHGSHRYADARGPGRAGPGPGRAGRRDPGLRRR